MELVGLVAASLVVGVVVGVLSGLLGIGGGTLLVPMFRLGYGLSPIVCTATSLFTIIPTSISGAVSHIRAKTCIPKLGVAMGIGGAITSILGVYLANISPEWLIIVVTACIIVYSAVTMFMNARKKGVRVEERRDNEVPASPQKTETGQLQAAVSEKPAASDVSPDPDALEVPDVTGKRLGAGLLIGLLAGVCAGFAGVGGGFVIVPLTMRLMRAPMKLASGTSLIAVMILAVPGVVFQAILGNVQWVAGIAVACGSIPGAIIGAHLIKRVPERALRLTFGCLLIVVAIVLVLNQLY